MSGDEIRVVGHTLQQQKISKATHHMLIMWHVFNLTTSNYLFKQGFI